MAADGLTYPRTWGRRADGRCQHCAAGPDCQAVSKAGIVCLACWRWLEYVGPPQAWGEGMWEPDDGRWLGRTPA